MNISYRLIANKVSTAEERPHCIAAGFDGFVDVLARPVKRIENGERVFFSTIEEFGSYITGKAGLSCSLDLYKAAEKAGGNMPIFASSLSSLGVSSHCVGALGYPEPLDIFTGLGERVSLMGVAGAGSCTALEFDDGKVMMGCNGDVDCLDFARLTERVGLAALRKWLSTTDGAAFLNWSELPGATSIWKGMLEEVLPALGPMRDKWLILDLSDCSRRPDAEICEMLALMSQLNRYYRVVFSLNFNESMAIGRAIGKPGLDPAAAAAEIFRHTDIELLALHLLDGAYAANSRGVFHIPGCRVEKPKISTGGGDHFNAGVMWGLLCGLEDTEALALACIMGSLYVLLGRSPSRQDIILELDKLSERNEHTA